MKTIAIISLTSQGMQLSRDLLQKLPDFSVKRFCFYKYADSDSIEFHDLSALTASAFRQFDALIFLSACGIAVRMIAPHIRSKQSDPAVLVIDHTGKFVIPILSGHLGGANALAERIAAQIGAIPVITTATDIGGKFSPDSFAAANQLRCIEPDAAKEIAAAVLRDESIGFRSIIPYPSLPEPLTDQSTPRCGIVVGHDLQIQPFSITLHLVPKNLVLGIGCKKGTPSEAIEHAVYAAADAAKIDIQSICAAASIDLKANEPGILQFCNSHNIPFYTYPASELMQVCGDFSASDFVRNVTGADNICERSAVLCSGGHLILKKTALHGVTAAIAEMPLMLDFERNMI